PGDHRESTLPDPCAGAESPGLREIFQERATTTRLPEIRPKEHGNSDATAIAVFPQSCAQSAAERSRPCHRNNGAGKPAGVSEGTTRSVIPRRARQGSQQTLPRLTS